MHIYPLRWTDKNFQNIHKQQDKSRYLFLLHISKSKLLEMCNKNKFQTQLVVFDPNDTAFVWRNTICVHLSAAVDMCLICVNLSASADLCRREGVFFMLSSYNIFHSFNENIRLIISAFQYHKVVQSPAQSNTTNYIHDKSHLLFTESTSESKISVYIHH